MLYPFQRCHKNIVFAVTNQLAANSLQWKPPIILDLRTANSFNYYLPGIEYQIGVAVDLSLQEGLGDFTSIWGARDGDSRGRAVVGKVDTVEPEVPMQKGRAVVKLYIDHHSHQAIGHALLNAEDMPKRIQEVNLSHRERSIMFIFGSIKNRSEREMALSRLMVSPMEIEDLCQKKAIKLTPKGSYIITLAGLAAHSEIPVMDLW